jgi:hypothetical protein
LKRNSSHLHPRAQFMASAKLIMQKSLVKLPTSSPNIAPPLLMRHDLAFPQNRLAQQVAPVIPIVTKPIGAAYSNSASPTA